MQIVLRENDQVLRRFANALGALDEGLARKVMVRGLNRTGGPALTQVRRAIAKRTSAPMAIVRRQVVASKAWAGDGTGPGKLEFKVRATGRPLPLRVFRPTEFKFGIRARVWGSVQRFEGAFTRGGLFPNRVELSRTGGNVFVRSGKARLPIEKMFGPSLPKELVEGEIVQVFEGAILRLGDDIAHELDRELSRFG